MVTFFQDVMEDSDIDCLNIENLADPYVSFDLVTTTAHTKSPEGVVDSSNIDSLLILNTEKDKPYAEYVSAKNDDLCDQPHAPFDLMTSTAYKEIPEPEGIMDVINVDYLFVLNSELNNTTVDEPSGHSMGQETEEQITEVCPVISSETAAKHYDSNDLPTCYELSDEVVSNNGESVQIFNYDEVSKKNRELTIRSNELSITVNKLETEVEILKVENSSLKQEVENGKKRNLMLQNYLVAANQTIPEDLYEEKDGGRLYKGGVFLNKNQCSVLDKSDSDREFLNNLTTAIFGREVLKTHSISGTPSNNTKGPAKNKLNPELMELIYEIMDARSFANNSKKLTKSEKNVIIGKKCSNVASYKPSAKSMSAASQNLHLPNQN